MSNIEPQRHKESNYEKEIKGEIWQICWNRWKKQTLEIKRMEGKGKLIVKKGKIRKKNTKSFIGFAGTSSCNAKSRS